MCKTACVLATALLATACADRSTDPSVVLRPSTEPREGTNGGPAFSAEELVNVMEGNGHLNSAAHRRYERKARILVGVPPGYINDPMDQELVGAMIGALTNTSGMVVHVKLASVAFGDHPDEWRREDRAHVFEWLGGSDVDAHYCLGDDVDRGVRDQRRADSYSGVDIGAFVNTEKACADISGYQQADQAYGDVDPGTRVYEETAILALLVDPADAETWLCVETGDCERPECEGAVALSQGETHCMGCDPAYVELTAEGESRCVSPDEDEAEQAEYEEGYEGYEDGEYEYEYEKR